MGRVVGEPVRHPVEQPAPHVVRRGAPPHRADRQVGQGAVVQAQRVASGGVLRHQARAEQQRVVRAEGHRHAGLAQGPHRHGCEVGEHAERDVGGRAELAHHLPRREQLEQARVLDGAHTVAEAPRAEQLHRVAHAARPPELARVRHRDQPGVTGQPERLGELPGHAARLVVGQPEPDHPPAGEAPGQPGERLGVAGVAGAVAGDHEGGSDAGRRRASGQRVQHQLDGRLQPAEPRCVRRGVDLQLQPARAGRRLVLDELAHDPPDLLGPDEQVARGVVQPLEPVPPAQPGDVDPRAAGVEQAGREPAALLLGQRRERRRPHAPGQVQVQVRLGQRAQVARGGQGHAVSLSPATLPHGPCRSPDRSAAGGRLTSTPAQIGPV